jgi:hypothetical protein
LALEGEEWLPQFGRLLEVAGGSQIDPVGDERVDAIASTEPASTRAGTVVSSALSRDATGRVEMIVAT